jgi:hypothetical protein
MVERLLLDSGVVDVPRSSHLIVVTLSSSKPLIFSMALQRHCPSRATLEPKTPESNKSDAQSNLVCRTGQLQIIPNTTYMSNIRIVPMQQLCVLCGLFTLPPALVEWCAPGTGEG